MKIFGIGLGRTGTKSLTKALRQLGFSIHHYPDDSITAAEVISGRPYSITDTCDGLTDLHATVRFKELDQRYPGSKFILTVRDRNSWLESCQRHFSYYKANLDPNPIRAMSRTLHLQAYGLDEFHATRFEEAYFDLAGDVGSHFCQRPNDMIAMDVVAGDGWNDLCPFLGLPVQNRPFPVTR